MQINHVRARARERWFINQIPFFLFFFFFFFFFISYHTHGYDFLRNDVILPFFFLLPLFFSPSFQNLIHRNDGAARRVVGVAPRRRWRVRVSRGCPFRSASGNYVACGPSDSDPLGSCSRSQPALPALRMFDRSKSNSWRNIIGLRHRYGRPVAVCNILAVQYGVSQNFEVGRGCS